MACKITRKNDRIFEVKTPTNERSLLFDSIVKIPHLRNTETALNVYKLAYTKEVTDNFEDWNNIIEQSKTIKVDIPSDIDAEIKNIKDIINKRGEEEFEKDKKGETAYTDEFFKEYDNLREELKRLEGLKKGELPYYPETQEIAEELNALNIPYVRDIGEYITYKGTYSKGKKIQEDEDLGGVYEVEGDGFLYRGVSLSDFERIKEQGYIDTDLRGAISEKEGINLATNARTAFNYLPQGEEGVVLAIKIDNKENLFMIGADDYVRSSAPISLDNIKFATTPSLEGRALSITEGKAKRLLIEEFQQAEEKEVTFIDDNDNETTFKLKDVEVNPVPVEEEDDMLIYTYSAKGTDLGSVTVQEIDSNTLRVNYSNLYGGKRSKEDIDSIFEASLAQKILDRIEKLIGNAFEYLNVNINIGQGIGQAAYIKLGEFLSSQGKVFQSDTKRSDSAEALWAKLEKQGLAKKVKNDFSEEIDLEKPLTYLYEYTPKEVNLKPNINKIKEYGKRIIEGRAIYKRFSQREQSGFIRGGKIHAEASLIIGGIREASKETSTEWEAQAEEVLEQYAKDNGIWVGDVKTKYGEPVAIGAEAFVWDEGSTVLKASSTVVNGNLQNFFDAITIHNTLFPATALEVVGFGVHSGTFQVMLRQPKITIERGAQPVEVRQFMERLGFVSEDYEEQDYMRDEYRVEDLHNANAVIDSEGNLQVIDALYYLNTPELGYGGKVTTQESVEEVLNKPEVKFNTLETGEPKLFFMTSDGNVSTSLKGALSQNSTTNGTIKVGLLKGDNVSEVTSQTEFNLDNSGVVVFQDNVRVNDETNFIKLLEIDGSTNEAQVSGFLNSQINRGLISDQLHFHNGEVFIQGAGENASTQRYNAQVALVEFTTHPKMSTVRMKDEVLITFQEEGNLENEDGTKIPKEEFDKNPEKFANNENLKGLLSTRANKSGVYAFSKDVLEGETLTESEEELVNAMLDFLNEMGIKQTTIDNYVENYKTKFGKEPSLKGLADIANQIIALKDGVTTKETFVEEVSHFLIEAFNGEGLIMDALLEVAGTEEYRKTKAKYESLYKDKYTDPTDLEEAIRREALGKILANSLLNNFSTENVTATEASVMGMLLDYLNNFINKIRSLFSSQMESRIDQLNSKIQTHILNRDLEIFNADKLPTSKFVLYDAGNAVDNKKLIVNRLSKIKEGIERVFNVNEGDIEKVNEDSDEITKWGAIANTVGVMEKEVNYLNNQVEAVIQQGDRPTIEMMNSYSSMKNVLMPILKEIDSYITRDGKPEFLSDKDFDNIKQSLADSMLEFSRVEGQWERIFSEEVFYDLVINEIAKSHNWSEEFKEQYKAAIKAEQKDVNVLMQSIGTVAHRGNPLLSLMQKQVSIINTRSDMNFLADSKGVIKEIYDKGFDKYVKDLQVRSEDGYATDRLVAPLRELEAEQAYKDFLLETKAKIKNYEYLEISDLRDLPKDHFTLNREEAAKLEIEKTRWKLDNLEQPFIEDYYREQLEWADRYPHIALGLATLKNFNRKLYEIKSRYKDANGRFDMSLLEDNKVDFEKYSEIQQEKKKMKLPYDSSFNLKKGIILNEEGRPIPDPNVNPETLSDDELTTWGMLKVEEYYREKNGGIAGEVSQEFMDKVLELEGMGDNSAYKFALANGGLNLNKSYWDSLSGDETYLQQIEGIIATLPQEERDIYQSYLEDYQRLTRHKQSLNKINRDLKQPLELNYSNNSADKKAILDIDEELENIREKLPRVERKGIADSEIKLNQSYYRDLKNEGIEQGSEEELRFLESNSTRTAKRRLGRFEDRLNRHINSGTEITDRDLQYVEGLDIYSQEGVLQASLNFARANVGSYYKRFTPAGYDAFLNDMEKGAIKPSILFNKEAHLDKYEGILRYIDFNPSFDWRLNDNNEDIVNKNYDQEGMNWQLKKEKWADDSFFEEFGINKGEFLSGTRFEDLTPTKNNEKFETLKLLTGWREQSLKRKGDNKFISKFRLPRISKTSLEKTESILKGGFPALKESLRELTSFRVDDLELGAEVDGTPLFGFYDLKAVPKFFETELENSTDQSEDIIGMLALDNQQANLYEQRSDMESKMLLTLNQLYSSNIEGKNAKESRSAKMAEEYINANLYGIQHNFDFSFTVMGKKVNAAKFLSIANTWIRNLNLKYNPLVDITGATTAGLSRLSLNMTEEFYSKDSAAIARKQVANMLPKLLQESGQVSKNSELQNLLEFFGDQDLTDRTQNSNYNRMVRLAMKSGYGLSKVSNLTNSPQILLTILNDTRFVNGRFMNYIEYSNLPENNVSGINDSDIRQNWKAFEEQSLMNVLDYSKPEVSFTEEFSNSVENPKQLLDDTVIKTTDRFSHLKELTDGVLSRENQVYAQRNPLLKFLLQHKGWLVINLDRKFKKRQWSTINNQEEIGQYTLALELISDSLRSYFGKNNKGDDRQSLYQIYKSAVANLPRNQRKALKGIRVDSMIVSTLTALGVGVLAFAEDDDNKDLWAAQLASLIYFRTLSERTSIGALGIRQTIMDNISSPVVGARTLDELTSLDGYSFEEVKSGKYKGHSKLMRKIAKLTLARRYFDLFNIEETSASYRFYNANSLNGLGQGGFLNDWVKGK